MLKHKVDYLVVSKPVFRRPARRRVRRFLQRTAARADPIAASSWRSSSPDGGVQIIDNGGSAPLLRISASVLRECRNQGYGKW